MTTSYQTGDSKILSSFTLKTKVLTEEHKRKIRLTKKQRKGFYKKELSEIKRGVLTNE